MIQAEGNRANTSGQVFRRTIEPKKRSTLKKYHTFSSSSFLISKEEQSTDIQHKPLKSQQFNRKKTQPGQATLMRKVSQIVYGERQKKAKTEFEEDFSQIPEGRKDECEDVEQLANDFLHDWSRMTNAKKQLYMKLRGKLVRQFPSMKKYYSEADIVIQQEQPAQKSKIQLNTNNNSFCPSLATSQKKSRNPSTSIFENKKILNLVKSAYFYSRSKKKCMKNIISVEAPVKQEKNIPIPRITYLNYKKHHGQKKKFKGSKIRGLNMIQKREELLELQEQGSKEYLTLKKCLQEAIDQCHRYK